MNEKLIIIGEMKGEVNQDKIGSQEGIDITYFQSSLRIKYLS